MFSFKFRLWRAGLAWRKSCGVKFDYTDRLFRSIRDIGVIRSYRGYLTKYGVSVLSGTP